MGALEQSRTAFELAVSTDPHWPRSLAMLVVLAERLRRPDSEIEAIKVRHRETKAAADRSY